MPVTRVLILMLLVGATEFALPSPSAHAQECVEVTQPNDDPPPNEITVGLYCPDSDDSGTLPPTQVGGGGGDGPACTWGPSPFHESEIREDGENWWLYYYDCDDGTSGTTWLCTNCSGPEDDEPDWDAIQDGLLLEATGSLDLPGPQLRHLYDSAPDGQVLGVVRAETWWWTETTGPVTVRGEDGPLWVEVTATLAGLEVDPGDGAPVVSCPSGGVPYNFEVSYYDQVGGSDCVHVYQQTSPAYTVTATLTWELAWVSGGPVTGAGGLPPATTSMTFALPVGELQSVVSG